MPGRRPGYYATATQEKHSLESLFQSPTTPRCQSCSIVLSEVAAFFNVCEQLYNFFRRPNIKSLYSGDSLKRVLDQCWEGHLAAARTLDKSMENVVEVLRVCDLVWRNGSYCYWTSETSHRCSVSFSCKMHARITWQTGRAQQGICRIVFANLTLAVWEITD